MRNFLTILLIILSIKGGAFAIKDIKLPAPSLKSNMSLESAINNRRTIRSYAKRELTMKQISQLLWAAQGITDKANGFRAAPSAGALYPFTIFLVKKDGLFEYIPQGHSIRPIITNDLRKNLSMGAHEQTSIAEAPINIILAADYRMTENKYGSRADRYVFLEAGHIAQNILLQAAALGLAGVPIGAFFDDKVKNAIYLDKAMDPVYIIPIGFPE